MTFTSLLRLEIVLKLSIVSFLGTLLTEQLLERSIKKQTNLPRLKCPHSKMEEISVLNFGLTNDKALHGCVCHMKTSKTTYAVLQPLILSFCNKILSCQGPEIAPLDRFKSKTMFFVM